MTDLERLLHSIEVRNNRLYLPLYGTFERLLMDTAVEIMLHYKPINATVRYLEFSHHGSIIKDAMLRAIDVDDIPLPVAIDLDMDVVVPFIESQIGTHNTLTSIYCPNVSDLCKFNAQTIYYFGKSQILGDLTLQWQGADFLTFESSTQFDRMVGFCPLGVAYMDLTFKAKVKLQKNGTAAIVIPKKWMEVDQPEEMLFRDWVDEINAEIYKLPKANDTEKFKHENYILLIFNN